MASTAQNARFPERPQVADLVPACQGGATEGQGAVLEAVVGGNNPAAPLLAHPTTQFEPFLDAFLLRRGSLVYSVFDGRELVATYDGEDLVIEPTHKGMGIEDTLPAIWKQCFSASSPPASLSEPDQIPGQWRHPSPEPWPDAGISLDLDDAEFMEEPEGYEGESPWATSLAGSGDGGWLQETRGRTVEAHHRHAPPKYHTSGGRWSDKKQCNGCGEWFAGGGFHSHTRGGCGAQVVVGEAKAKRFTAFCHVCYSQRLETNSRKEADRWCTSHMNAYGHECSVIDNRRESRLAEEFYGDPFGSSEIGSLSIEDTDLGPKMAVAGVQVRQSPEDLPGTQYLVGEWTPPWMEHGVAPSKFLPKAPILWVDLGDINPYRGRNPRPRKSNGNKPAGPYPALVVDPYGNLEDGYHRYYEDFVDNGYSGPVPVQVLESVNPRQCDECGRRTEHLDPFDIASGPRKGGVSWVCASCSGLSEPDGFRRIVAEAMHQLSQEDIEPPTDCEYYRSGFCAITGGVCPHYESTFRRCEVREYAIANRDRVRVSLPDEETREEDET